MSWARPTPAQRPPRVTSNCAARPSCSQIGKSSYRGASPVAARLARELRGGALVQPDRKVLVPRPQPVGPHHRGPLLGRPRAQADPPAVQVQQQELARDPPPRAVAPALGALRIELPEAPP